MAQYVWSHSLNTKTNLLILLMTSPDEQGGIWNHFEIRDAETVVRVFDSSEWNHAQVYT